MTAPSPTAQRAAEPWDELRANAIAARPHWGVVRMALAGNPLAIEEFAPFVQAATPDVTLALLNENDALRALVATLTAERDAAREALRMMGPLVSRIAALHQSGMEELAFIHEFTAIAVAARAALSQPASGAMEAPGDE